MDFMVEIILSKSILPLFVISLTTQMETKINAEYDATFYDE